MDLLFERLLKTSLTPYFQNALDGCELIMANEIAELYYQSEQLYWDLAENFPNCAPVFPRFFIEYFVPTEGYFIEGGRTLPRPVKFGLLFVVHDLREEKQPLALTPRISPSARWFYEVTIFAASGKPLNTWFLNIGDNGSVIPISNKGWYSYSPNYKLSESEIDALKKQGNEPDIFISHLHVGLLAISFMHCKNVSLVPHLPHKSPSGRRHSPGIVYKTLEIEPMKKVLQSDGQLQQNGLKRALHICRGHFKDFSKGKGLFGKYQGLYWWDSQVRGNISEGIVIKDYSIDKPSGPILK